MKECSNCKNCYTDYDCREFCDDMDMYESIEQDMTIEELDTQTSDEDLLTLNDLLEEDEKDFWEDTDEEDEEDFFKVKNMTLDEAIRKYEAQIDNLKESCKDPKLHVQGLYGMQELHYRKCDINEYSQLVEWLKEFKENKKCPYYDCKVGTCRRSETEFDELNNLYYGMTDSMQKTVKDIMLVANGKETEE